MNNVIKNVFQSLGLEVGFARFDRVRLKDTDNSEYRTVIVSYLPYYYPKTAKGDICKYASLPDYHKYFAEKLRIAADELKELFPSCVFDVYVDKSPVDEKKAAIEAGLGIKGKNSLLITKKHGSFVFLGTICTNSETEIDISDMQQCTGCDLCVRACPVNALETGILDTSKCLSAVTQKKGELTDEETKAIKASGIAWGCDVCQDICPYNKDVMNTYSEFAEENIDNIISNIDSDDLAELTEKEFQKKYSERAFVWRGRKTLLRNLKIIEDK